MSAGRSYHVRREPRGDRHLEHAVIELAQGPGIVRRHVVARCETAAIAHELAFRLNVLAGAERRGEAGPTT